jgi:hypothetical protein
MTTHHTIFYVPCTTMWKHVMSSLWTNTSNFIVQLFCIHNPPKLVVFIPHHFPCTPYVDYVNTFVDYVNTYTNSVDAFDTPTSNFCILDSSLTHLSLNNCVVTLALGSRLRQGLARMRAKREARESHFMLMSAKECEGMNLHTPKGTPTLGVGVKVDSRIFRERSQESKFIGLRCFLYHWKTLGT